MAEGKARKLAWRSAGFGDVMCHEDAKRSGTSQRVDRLGMALRHLSNNNLLAMPLG